MKVAAVVILLSFVMPVWSQGFLDSSLVQFSGVVVTDQKNEPLPIPYSHISIENSRRGTFADRNGFFSLVVQKGDTLMFSALGFKKAHYIVPEDLKENRYSIFQIMYTDTITLPETIIYPWPSKENFKLEFLALDVSDKMREIAAKNLADNVMANLRKSLPRDGGENFSTYQRQVVQSYYYAGQYKPINLFNVVAWKKFFDAWKKGDFKKKKKDDE
ncbi:MAG: carboxypeptidase-like regulatory domain-containing protein [Saprospiraceae bacterium]